MPLTDTQERLLRAFNDRYNAQTPRDRDLGLPLKDIAEKTLGPTDGPKVLDELWHQKLVEYDTMGGGSGYLTYSGHSALPATH